MKLICRVVGNFIFLSAFALSAYLAWVFHGQENIVALGVSGLALVISAFGLLSARHSWRERDSSGAAIGVALWVAGACAFGLTELGFWFSSYNERHEIYMQEKKAQSRHEGLKDQAWNALTTGEVPMTSAQIEADLNGKQLDPIYARSKSCSDATLLDSRAFCGEIFALRSKLASVRNRERFERQISETAAPEKKGIIHNVFAQAELLANFLGISERQAATIVILSTWILLMIARDGGAIVANPMGSRRKAEDAVKAAEKPQEPAKLTPAPSPRGGTKQPVLPSEIREKLASHAPRSEVTPKLPEPTKPYIRIDNTPKGVATIADWQATFLMENDKKGSDGNYWHQPTVKACWEHYAAWCKSQGKSKEVKNDSWFGRKLNVPKERRKGKYHGANLLGYELLRIKLDTGPVMAAEQKRKVA